MGSPPSLRSTWRFDSNGSGVATDSSGMWCPVPWAVQGDQLLIGYRPKMLEGLLTRISRFSQPSLGYHLFYPGPSVAFRIVSVSDATIELETDAFLAARLSG
jgi:hypothetical protein